MVQVKVAAASLFIFYPFNAGIKSLHAKLPAEIFYWEF
jgi:hypothetical protein